MAKNQISHRRDYAAQKAAGKIAAQPGRRTLPTRVSRPPAVPRTRPPRTRDTQEKRPSLAELLGIATPPKPAAPANALPKKVEPVIADDAAESKDLPPITIQRKTPTQTKPLI